MSVRNNSIKDKIKKGGSPAKEFISSFGQPEEIDDQETKDIENKIDITNDIDKENSKVNKTNIANDNNITSNSDNTIENKTNSENASNVDIKSAIENILESESPKKEFVGIYLDSDVHRALNKLCHKSKKKGIKSKVVNDILRSVLKEQGIL